MRRRLGEGRGKGKPGCAAEVLVTSLQSEFAAGVGPEATQTRGQQLHD